MVTSDLTETVDRAIINGDPLRLAAHYRDLNNQKKALETRLEALKPAVDKLVPATEKKVAYLTEIDGKPYEYVVTRARQDRRVIDSPLLGEFLFRRGLKTAIEMKPWPVEEKVAELVKAGTIERRDLETCMKGPVFTYPLVTLREVKTDDE